MPMDELMVFRTTYLRAVAQAWSDDSFKARLLINPIETLRMYFRYDWPWDNVCDLVIKEAKATEGQFFTWINDEWIWSDNMNEGLLLRIPLAPATALSIPPDQDDEIAGRMRAMALADHYRQRSSLFSDDWGREYNRFGPIPPTGEPQGNPLSNGEAGTGSGVPAGGFIPAADEFASFKVVLLAAMGLAWRDPTYKGLLTTNPVAALRAIRQYEMPWKMLIGIENDPTARWHPPGTGDPGDNQSYWQERRNHQLTLYLPSRPQEPKSQPLALAMYNAVGSVYPFTCCCMA